MNPKHILIVSGEPSGDLHASNLVKDLKRLNPNLEFFGIGGNLSKNAGVEINFDISGLALVGVVEVLKNISIVKRAYNSIIAKVDSEKVDLAILVDYPGFNLRLARALKARAIPIVYYISPQVWAWGENRIKIIKKCVKKIIVFFVFEEELYRRHGVDVEYVGNPLIDIAKPSLPKEEILKKYGLSRGKTTIAILPGSRALEVKALLSIIISSCKIMNEKLRNAQFIIAKYQDLPIGLYEEAIKDSKLDIRIADGDTYNALSAADFAIVASGTATLETAIIGVPFLIVYRTNFLTDILGRLVVKTAFLGLVNIIAKKELVPELLQSDATPEKIAKKAIEIMTDEKKKSAMLDGVKKVKSYLGSSGASLRAAQAILPLLK